MKKKLVLASSACLVASAMALGGCSGGSKPAETSAAAEKSEAAADARLSQMLRKTGHTVKAAIKIREGITNSHPMRVFRSSRCFFVCVFIFYSPFIRFRENSKNMKQIGAAVKHDSTNFISKVSFYPTDTQTELLLPVPELRLMLLQQLRHQLLQTGYCHLRLSRSLLRCK